MDVTKILEADHRQVDELFSQIEKADGAERTPFLEELATSLRAHMKLEEQVVYPRMKPVVGDDAVEEGETEHKLAREALDDVMNLAPDEPGFGAALDAAKAGIHHHVEEEETEIFPKLRETGASVLQEMATPFMQKRIELGMPMGADALGAASTKDELLAEARSAEVEGAGSMTKAELAAALAAKMA